MATELTNKEWKHYLLMNYGTYRGQEGSILRSPAVKFCMKDGKATIVTSNESLYIAMLQRKEELGKIVHDFTQNDIEIQVLNDIILLKELSTEEEKAKQEAIEKEQAETRKQMDEQRLEEINSYLIDKDIDQYSFDNYKLINPANKKAIDLCKAWANDRAWDDETMEYKYHPFLTIAGTPGTGKTRMAKTIWRYKVEHASFRHWYNNYRYDFWQTPALIRELHKFEHGADEVAFKHCREAEFLILDDIGMEQDTEWVRTQLDSLIDIRYDKGLETIFTTNKALKDLPNERIRSRLAEGELVVLLGEDYRKVIAKDRIAKRNKNEGKGE